MPPDGFGDLNGDANQSTTRSVPSRRRRNGTLPSCENCRIAKARCDHNAPCSRCSRQGKTCFFHPAPMSQHRGTTGQRADVRQVRTSSTLNKDIPARKSSEQSQIPMSICSSESFGHRRTATRLSMGYMGSTGHAAILEENKDARLWDEVNESGDESIRDNSPALEDEIGQKFGIAILARLPSQDFCERLIDVNLVEFELAVLFQPRRVQYYMKEFWKQYGHLLREPRDYDRLRQVCLSLNNNTRRPLPIPSSNSEWISSFCGPNSRWEVLGEFFITIGAGIFAMPNTSRVVAEILKDQSDRKTYAGSMLECGDQCLVLCDALASPSNILVATLLARCVQLQSTIAGDSSYEVWKRVGHLVAAATGLGLHLKANPEESRSSLYHEQRARNFTAAYALDKEIATFMGRPPLLSRRFVSADLPLDVNEDDLWSESDISVLQAKLDHAGWNREGKILPTTVIRTLAQLRHLRDEILELSLSIKMPDDLGARIESLRARIEQCFSGFPVAFHEHIDKSMLPKKSSWELLCICQTQLFHLQNIFLCERIKHEGQDEQRFLQASRDILGIVNTFWSGRDRYIQLRDVAHWWITCFGVPCASALAIDLWKQISSPMTVPPAPDRPQVIQSLSVFIASLDWIDEDCGNFKLCQRIKRFLNDILNRVLLPQTPTAVQLSLPSFTTWNADDFSLAGMPNFGPDFDDLDGWFNAPLMN